MTTLQTAVPVTDEAGMRPSIVLLSIASPSFIISIGLGLLGHLHAALIVMLVAHAPLDAYLILLSRYLQPHGV